ncbi:MAG: class I SAM-dependent methyltransferase [Planctomycetes bacterium]|nr:class I SAM-dependent methyltransferase [Planctomycetota bacterium]
MNRQAIFAAMPGPLKSIVLALIDRIGLSKVDPRSWDSSAASRLRKASDVSVASIMGDTQIAAEWETLRPEIEALRITDKADAVNPGDRRAIYYLVRGLGVRTVLELGTHIGGSTLHFALGLRQNAATGTVFGSPEMVSVDIADVNDRVTRPWIKYGSTYSPAEMTKMARCDGFVTFVTMNSLDYYPTCNRTFDFVFIDSSHSAKATWVEVVAAMKVLSPGGVILLHDYYPGGRALWEDGAPIPGPYRAIRYLQSMPGGSGVSVIPLGELPWATRSGSNMTSLALVLRA